MQIFSGTTAAVTPLRCGAPISGPTDGSRRACCHAALPHPEHRAVLREALAGQREALGQPHRLAVELQERGLGLRIDRDLEGRAVLAFVVIPGLRVRVQRAGLRCSAGLTCDYARRTPPPSTLA